MAAIYTYLFACSICVSCMLYIISPNKSKKLLLLMLLEVSSALNVSLYHLSDNQYIITQYIIPRPCNPQGLGIRQTTHDNYIDIQLAMARYLYTVNQLNIHTFIFSIYHYRHCVRSNILASFNFTPVIETEASIVSSIFLSEIGNFKNG